MNFYRASFRLLFFLVCLISASCKNENTLFEKISSSKTGIHFNNFITESDSVNPVKLEFLYNGNGIAAGDFNNDGLQDLYFTASQVSNKLYLNKGDFKFTDVTEEAGVTGNNRWCNGASVVDINNDGRQDIYVCATIKNTGAERQNLLYINQGINKNNIPVFKEMAAEYNLADTGYSVQAAFFDYDNDQDLDMFLLRTQLSDRFPGTFGPIIKDGSSGNNDKLFRNDRSKETNHPVFTDVTWEAGILWEGYGLGVNIMDINLDGWKDIYVTNDFVGDDVLYINNRDGTFTNKAHTYFKHTSANAMGNDVADINNDGLADFIAVDMNPEDNYRKKMMLDANKYQQYQNLLEYDYMLQYVKNTLQLNKGPRINANDSIGEPVFSEIAFLSGVAQTDWSWSPLLADFDNDGFRDLMITNGYPKDVTDHDFVAYRRISGRYTSALTISEQIPQVKIPDYAYKNNGNLSFTNVTKEWGMHTSSFSNGAVYVDLDNDGDLDYAVNNVNGGAFIYRNTLNAFKAANHHYLKVSFKGDSLNKSGLGAIARIYYGEGRQQVCENSPYRGYLSTVENTAHFGLGNTEMIDSLVITWPGGKLQSLLHLKTDQLITVNIKNAVSTTLPIKEFIATNNLFTDVTDSVNIHFVHEQSDFIDFNIQKLLPHKFSDFGPGLAVGDVDGNGTDDIISGGATGQSPQLFLQQKDSRFTQKSLLTDKEARDKKYADMGMLLFDADNDGDLDLYSSSGGFEAPTNSVIYRDKFYVNDGKGNYREDTAVFPVNLTSKFCVRAADYDKDGDLDLFVAGRVDPWNYPKPVSSFIFRNDSKPGNIKFADATNAVAKDLLNIGLTCDAVFTDFDNDGWQDIILAGEWMPISFLKNEKGIFKNVTSQSGISDRLGWWTSLAPGDFDNDGDIDYIVGNTGTNSYYQASMQFPVYITAKDFDNNGSYDAFPSLYLNDVTGKKKEFPAQARDDAVKQMISLRTKFQNYKSYAVATMEQVIPAEQRKNAIRLSANIMQSCYITNKGNGKFTLKTLPVEAQVSTLNGMIADDFNGDGNLDIIINGNDFGGEVANGRYDALDGLLLAGNGKGDFKALSILQSGIFIPGDGKALVKLTSSKGKYLVAASQNKGPLKIFKSKKNMVCTHVLPRDVYAVITSKNGAARKQEFYYGSSFLSQSARFVSINDATSSVIITDEQGHKRNVNLQSR